MAVSPAKIWSRCSARAWGGSCEIGGPVNFPLPPPGTAMWEEPVWLFLPEGIAVSHPLSLVFNGGWQFYLLCFSLSSLHSFCSACFFLATSFEERGGKEKFKGSPHTQSSNIIRPSQMALLQLLPCACVLLYPWFSFFSVSLLDWLFSLWGCVCAHQCVYMQPVRALLSSGTGPGATNGPPCHQTLHIEQDVRAPLQHSARGSCPLFDVTSVLLWSSSTTVTPSYIRRDNREIVWRKNIWSVQEQRSQTTCWIKAAFSAPPEGYMACAISSFNYNQRCLCEDSKQ